MRFGSILIFVVAFSCAGAAALLVRAALMTGNETPAVEAKPAAVATRTVLVAARDLKAGEKLTADLVRGAGWPADLLPHGAFASREILFRGAEERTLSAAIAENEPILAQRLQASSDSLAGRLNDGMRGVTIRVNEASSVGGFVQPEDRVDVLMTQTENSGVVTNGLSRAYTKTLIKNVRVLAADQQVQRKQQTQPPKTVTLEVSEEDAKKLTLAGTIGQLSLTLNKGENSQQAGRAVDLRDIVPLADEKKQEAAAIIEDAPVVAVFRAAERKEYRVPQQ